MRSIRRFLLLRLLAGAAVVLAAAGLVVYLLVARSLEAQFDRNLGDRLQGLASILFQVEDTVDFAFSEQLMPEYAAPERPAYFELRFADGALLERSESLGERDLALPAPAAEAPRRWSAPLPDGRPGRYASRLVEVHHVFPEEGPDRPEARRVAIVVARGREELVAAERTVLLECVAVALVLLGLLAFVARRAVERGLEPARRLAGALGDVRAEDLPEELALGPLPEELEPVARKSEELLRRLGAALARERRTAADIAHELRTPISEALTVSEVALRNGHDAGAERRALATLRDIAWRMGRSVSTLMKLARLEMGAETFAREEVELGVVVADLLRSLSTVARERGLAVENEVAPDERVLGDRDVLAIVASNLLGNALYYSPAGAPVRCAVERGPEGWCLVVENEAPDLRAEDLGSLTEPFWRKDRARADRERSGLGLGLSRALAGETGMELRFELEGGRFRALLRGRG